MSSVGEMKRLSSEVHPGFDYQTGMSLLSAGLQSKFSMLLVRILNINVAESCEFLSCFLVIFYYVDYYHLVLI